MPDLKTTLPPALSRALDLLADPPAEPDVSNGYLDLLGTAADNDVAKNSGAIQAAWASPIGSFVYDNAQALTRRFIAAWQLPIDWLDVPRRRCRLRCRRRPRIGHHITGPRRRTRRARAGRRHLRADAGPRGARRGGPAGRVLARGRAATAVPGRDGRRRGVDRGVAADPGPGGRVVGDRPRAEARWPTGADGSHPASAN